MLIRFPHYLNYVDVKATGGSQEDIHGTWEDKSCSFVLEIVKKPQFEAFFFALIMANTMTMAAEAQYNGFDIGNDLNFHSTEKRAADAWPGVAGIFPVVSFCFGAVFTLEAVLKVIGLRLDFFRDPWNWIDSTIVIVWILTQAIPRA